MDTPTGCAPALAQKDLTSIVADQRAVEKWCTLLREWNRDDTSARTTVGQEIYLRFRVRVAVAVIAALRQYGAVSGDNVEDGTQETFAQLIAYIHNNPRRFADRLAKCGLGGLVRLLQKMARQQVGRMKAHAGRTVATVQNDILDSWASSGRDPVGEAATDRVEAQRIVELVAAIDTGGLLTLHDVDGVTYQQIAARNETTEDAIRMRLHRLRVKARQVLKDWET